MTRTLHIRLGPTDHGDLEEALGALDAGQDIEAKPATLSIEGLETLGRIFRSTNLELLQAIIEHDPESIRALARVVDRHPPDVLENVHELADYGLIELREEGRSKRPLVWYDELDIDVPLRTDDSGADAVTP